MNAIMQITEIHREQHQRHQDRLSRLWGRGAQPAPRPIEPPIDVQELVTKKPRSNNRQSTVLKVLDEKDERIRVLELDLADAHARMLSQAERICALDSIEGDGGQRRPVAVIVAEVLRDFPDVTWEDIKGVSRKQAFVRPRHLCIYAVYQERKDLSYPRMGKMFGGRDHSSLIHAVRKIAAEKEGQTT